LETLSKVVAEEGLGILFLRLKWCEKQSIEGGIINKNSNINEVSLELFQKIKNIYASRKVKDRW
jgi:hypothetical protein